MKNEAIEKATRAPRNLRNYGVFSVKTVEEERASMDAEPIRVPGSLFREECSGKTRDEAHESARELAKSNPGVDYIIISFGKMICAEPVKPEYRIVVK